MPATPTLDAAGLAAWVDEALERSEGLLFRATPREELAEIGLFQQLKDQSWAGLQRPIVAAYNRAPEGQREFVPDEVGLAVGATPTTGSFLVGFALGVCRLPGLLEAVEGGQLTERHVRRVMEELDKVLLSQEQREAVVLVLLARYDRHTPGELAQLTRQLILTVDLAAARTRRDVATRNRGVSFSSDADGQSGVWAHGPTERIAAVRERLRAEVAGQELSPEDERTVEARTFDLMVDLLTRGTVDDRPVAPYAVQVVTPFATADGGDLELAEIPGFGPILPDTARDLVDQAATLTQVAVDEHGDVIAVSPPVPGPGAGRFDPLGDLVGELEEPVSEQYRVGASALRLMARVPEIHLLHTDAYRPTAETVRVVKARDRTCVYPGCHRRAVDLDHRIPWPLGPTDATNLECVCRHHHRAKQAVFGVERLPDGSYVWTTRGGWQFVRRRQGY